MSTLTVRNKFTALTRALTLGTALLLCGCGLVGAVTKPLTQGFAESLAGTILNSEDVAMVRDGAPAYLLLVDTLLADAPDDGVMLEQSSILHSAYAAAFVTEPQRSKLLHTKAKALALRAACLRLDDACDLDQRSFRAFQAWVDARSEADVPLMYTLASSWTGWIQAHSDDFAAIAELARAKAIMTKVAELAPAHESGSAFLYLGVFETLLPPAMGGRPEVGRAHFERAVALSEGNHLLTKVMFADQYARLVFDRELHDRLLQEVVSAPANVPGLTLMNTIAKQQAKELLDSADEYF